MSHTNSAQDKLQQIQNNFGAAANDYVTSAVHASGQDLQWIVTAAALTGHEHVIDIATGAGHTAFALAPHAAEVVALDLTTQMLNAAQQEATSRQLHNIRFLQGNAQAIPCDDATFDVVSCRMAAHHFPDVQQAIQEWSRVLKPNGKLILVDTISPENTEAEAFLHEIELLRDPSHVRNYKLSTWRSMLTTAGFTIQHTQEWGIYLDIPSWTQRMRTPATSVATIEHNMHTASPAVRNLLHIEEPNNILGFSLPTTLIVATK